MNLQYRIEHLSKTPAGKAGQRILAELRYACEVSKVDQGKWDELIGNAVHALEERVSTAGVISAADAQAAEELLMPMQKAAKRYTVLCVGHAHIDMNWMWRYDETVSITLDTFRTVLKLLKEYPDFCFSQSQASVYEMVEKYDPEMLDDIRHYVAEGRWELSASTWVESDKNMPSAESMARQMVYTKRYLTKLLGATEEDFRLDFEPDTFGHNANVPEILSEGGVKYYYHCRGDEGELLYRWKSASGADLLCYREPFWYLGPVGCDFALGAPKFCARYGMDTHMRVYGVGDHGGGPTRRDIERIIEMGTWPIFPVVRFGTYKEFYKKAEQAAHLPEYTGELNCIFTGCYTSQSRITRANRFGEAKLDESEKFTAISADLTGLSYPKSGFESAWRKILFNQFHDILPGSGVVDTREYAMGSFSEAVALADTQKAKALRSLGEQVDTSAYISDKGMEETTSEGAGVGFGVGYGEGTVFRIAQTERGRGINRVFHVFNPSANERTEVVELTMFDWPGDYDRMRVIGADGEEIPYQFADTRTEGFWQHEYRRILVLLRLPAGGRLSCVITEDTDKELPGVSMGRDPRTEKVERFVLENENIRAEFSPETGAMVSLVDKQRGKEYLDAPSAFFRMIHEQPAEHTAGTAWTVGQYKQVTKLTKNIVVRQSMTGPLKDAITITVPADASTLTYTISLAKKSNWLDISCVVNWREIGIPGELTPQLGFTLPFGQKADTFTQDIPGGLIRRPGRSQDVPCQRFAAAGVGCGRMLMLLSDAKYGFRCEEDPATGTSVMSLDCIRSSSDPDSCPEVGEHTFRIGIALTGESDEELMHTAYDFCHAPTMISDLPRRGTRPMCESLFAVSGGILTAMKQAEEGNDLILRVVPTAEEAKETVIGLWRDVKQAEVVDLHEQTLRIAAKDPTADLKIDGKQIICRLPKDKVMTIRVAL